MAKRKAAAKKKKKKGGKGAKSARKSHKPVKSVSAAAGRPARKETGGGSSSRKLGHEARNTGAVNASTVNAGQRNKAGRGKARGSARRGTEEEIERVPRGSQSVETVTLQPRRRATAAGYGGGDLAGVSVIAEADSESAEELQEEGQTFESGIIRGVEAGSNADDGGVRTHEVPQDDVPLEYEDKDRL